MNTENRRGLGPWPSLLLLAGAIALYVGERLLTDDSRLVLDGVAGLLLLAGLAGRLLGLIRATEGHAAAQRKLTAATVVALGGLALYGLSTDTVLEALGGAPGGALQTVLARLWPAVLAIGAVPLILLEAAYGPMRRAERVEAVRLSQAGAGGVSLACAAAFLFVANWLAIEHDIEVDRSYFRTAIAGEATRGMVARLEGDLRVHLFFPRANEVLGRVQGYFAPLQRASSNLQVEVRDRYLEPDLARKFAVRKEGTVVLETDERHESFLVGTEEEAARKALKDLDQTFAERFAKVTSPAKVAYRVVGHGEAGSGGEGVSGSKSLEGILRIAGFKLKPLGFKEGLGGGVPDDAELVVVLGPTQPFLPEEEEALAAYARRDGSRLLLGLDPDSEAELTPLFEALGLTYEARGTPLCHMKAHRRLHFNKSDRTLLIAGNFSSHPTVHSLIRARRYGVTLLGAGALGKPKDARKGLTVRFPMRSVAGTWKDLDGDFEFDKAEEKKGTLNLLAAVSRKPGEQAEGEEKPRQARAVAIADGDVFGDLALINTIGNRILLSDVVRWLADIEGVTGTVSSGADEPLEHTRDQDLIWFYGTVFVVPALVLGGGLGYLRWRRRKGVPR